MILTTGGDNSNMADKVQATIDSGSNRTILIKNTGGDGVYLGSTSLDKSSSGLGKNLLIDNAYRNGISIVAAENLTIQGCEIKNTSGKNDFGYR